MNNKEKYVQDQNWMRAAFPEDYLSRKSYATAVLDPELCGKWKVRIRRPIHRDSNKIAQRSPLSRRSFESCSTSGIRTATKS